MSDNNTFTKQSNSASVSDAAPSRRLSSVWVRLVGYVVGIMIAVGLIVFGFWVTSLVRGNSNVAVPTPLSVEQVTPVAPVAVQRPVVTEGGLVEKSGVKIVYVAITGDGGLIDLRFQVVDPNKAGALHDLNYPPTIVEDSTGLIINNLLMGHSHEGAFNAGQIYYMIFENPGNIVQSGSKVSVLLGNTEVDGIVVK